MPADAFTDQRLRMVEAIARRGVADRRVLAALRSVPRDRFVPAEAVDHAYADAPLAIGEGQTISQPFVVALMLEALQLRATDRLLEIGAGSGYAAALAGRLVGRVDAVERHASLARAAAERLARLGYGNVSVHHGDGTRGWPDGAPYDAILGSASGRRIPSALLDQLQVGGRLVMPVGWVRWAQRLVRLTRRRPGAWDRMCLGPVRFVPLVSGTARDA